MKKRMIAPVFLLLLIMGALTLTASAADIVTSGKCGTNGDNLMWTLDSEGQLTISGAGAMADYSKAYNYNDDYYSTAPWGNSSYRNQIKTLTISSGITHIGSWAFYRLNNVTAINLPDTVTSIGNYAFCDCYNLASVALPEGLDSIGDGAFSYHYQNLTSLTIPKSVKAIGNGVFANGSSELMLTVYAGSVGETYCLENSIRHTTIGEASGECGADGDNLAWTLDNEGQLTISGTGAMADYSKAYNLNDDYYSTASWGSSSYRNRIKTLTISSGITHIGSWAFYRLNNVTAVNVPDTVTSIGNYAFCDCYNLSSVTLPEGLESIGDGAFSYHYQNLTSLTIPKSVKTIGSGVFANGSSELVLTVYAGSAGETYCLENSIRHTIIGTEQEKPDKPTVTKKPIRFINRGSYSLLVGGTLEITAVIPDAEQSDYQGWSKEDDEVIYRTHSKTFVLDGLLYATTTVQGISPGERTLTVSAKDGRSATCTITVLPRIEISEAASSTFNADVYRADWLLDIDNHPMAKSVRNLLNEDTPSHMLCKAGEENGLLTAMNWWDAVKAVSEGVDDLSTVADLFYDPIDAYTAIILDTLEEISSNDKGALGDYFDWAGNIVEGSGKLLGDTSDIASTFKDALNSYAVVALNIPDLQNLDTLSAETKKKLREWAGEYFETLYPDDNDFIEGLGITASGVQVAGDVYSYAQKMASYHALAHYGAQTKALLRELQRESESSGDQYLKAAFRNCIDIMDQSVSGMMVKVSEGIYVVGKNAIGFLWDVQVKEVLYTFPAVLVWQTAYKVSRSFSNFLFNTDNTIDAFSKMQSIYAVETVADRVYRQAMSQFSANKKEENAALYLASLDFVFALRGQDCQNAYDYVNALDGSGVNTIWKIFGNDTYASSKAALSSLQKSYHITHESALTAWIYALQEDPQYSSLYPTYEHLIEQSFERTKKKKFVAACPVDVYVYNAENQVVAAVANGVVSSVDTIDAALLGEKKVFWFYDDHPYRVEYIGNASGAMDVTITEFGEAQEITRTVNYYDVQLTNGLIYQMDAPASESAQNPAPYELKDSVKTTVVNYDYDSVLTESPLHTVKVVSGTLVHDGISSTSAEAKKGEAITLHAYVPAGYKFVRWNVTSGTGVSLNATEQSATLIMPEQDVAVEAVLQLVDTAVVRADGVQTETGSTVNAKVCCVGNSATTVYCAFYNEVGKMLSVDIKSANSGENDLSFTTSSGGVATAKLMVLDSQMIPQCDSKAVEVI